MWRKTIYLTIVGIFLLLLGTNPSLAAEIYVDADSGSDAEAGTISAPLKSIQTALSQAAAQDTIYIRGTSQYSYNFLDTLTITQEGLTITNWGDNLAYFDLLATKDTFDIQANNVTLNGLAFQESSVILNGSGVGASSINISSGVTDTTITNCSFLFGVYAVYLNEGSDSTIISQNTVSGDLNGAFSVTASDNVEISENEINIYNNSEVSIFYDIYFYNSSNATITKNKVYGTPASSVIAISGGDNTLIANNLIYDNDDISYGAYVVDSTDTYIYNNTFYNNYAGVRDYENSNTNLIVKNNIFANNYYGLSLENSSSSTYNYNLFNNNTCTTLIDVSCSSDPIGKKSLTKSPKFTNSDNKDFSLQSGSYAIDHGASLSMVSDDYAGLSRPYGDYYDIGAYEYEKNFTPNKVLNPQIKNKQATQVKFQWKKRTAATKYYVKLMHKNGKKIALYKKVKKRYKVLKNLKPGKTYKVKTRAVRVKNGLTYLGKWSKVKNFTTLSE